MPILLIAAIFCCSLSICLAQSDSAGTSSVSSIRSPTGASREASTLPLEGELNDVRFIGNSHFTSSALQDVISSLPSDLSFAHRIFRFYYRQLSINPYTPQPLEDALGVALTNYQDEYRYFDQTGVENDIATLLDVYNQYGFHNAKATYSYDFDSTNQINVLTFSITENHQYQLDTIVYQGLEQLPADLLYQIRSMLPTVKGIYFNEPSIKSTADAIISFLQNNGYYYSHYTQPIVHSSSVSYSDSVVIPFIIGKRCVFGHISIKSDFKGQNPISSYLIRLMFDMQPGEWYNRSKVGSSQTNLYNLTTFDLVSIDTSSTTHGAEIDTLHMQVFLQYLKQAEIIIAPYINHTTYDNFTNLGFETSFYHRNLFGAAQNVSLFGRYVLQDFSLLSSPHSIAQEYQIGGLFSQPVLFEVSTAKIDMSFQTSYSYRYLNSGLSTQTIPLNMTLFPLRLNFMMRFPSHTFFNSLVFELFTELQQLHNFLDVSADMYTNSQTTEELLAAVQFLSTFGPINTYAGDQLAHPGQIFSMNLISDSRNNPFSPTKGLFLSTSFEFALGKLYNFRRFQITYYQFFPSGQLSTFACKFRLGNIWIDLGSSYYIPFERHFFAGGANSVRSYSSRSLSDTFSSLGNTKDYNLLGNATIIEGSFEYRFRFGRPRGMNSMLADQVQQMGITTFVDWGNAFNLLDANKYGTARISNFIEGLAIGFGLGFRYETPVGPFRVDIATQFHDPTSSTDPWIFTRSPFSSENLQLHIGLGHAF